MYPIERQGSINAHIGATSEEIRECRTHGEAESETVRTANRFYQILAGKLNSWRSGAAPPTRPLRSH